MVAGSMSGALKLWDLEQAKSKSCRAHSVLLRLWVHVGGIVKEAVTEWVSTSILGEEQIFTKIITIKSVEFL